MSEPVRADHQPRTSLRRLAGENEPLVLFRHPLAASRLAGEYEWLIDRVADRLAACWPAQAQVERLRREAWIALQQTAACVERVEDLPAAAAEAIDQRMRELLAAGEWYRRTLAQRVRPLYEAWRGMVIAGRRPTDQTLCARLHIGTGEIAALFVDAALVFLIDPAALLPARSDALQGMVEVIVDLPTDQQLATALYFEQHLTIPEIARVMTIEPVAAQELLGRAGTCIIAHAGLPEWAAGSAVSA